jgi:hypothetical protein
MGSTFKHSLLRCSLRQVQAILVLGCHGHMAPCSSYYILGSTCDTFVVYMQLQSLGFDINLALGSLHSPDKRYQIEAEVNGLVLHSFVYYCRLTLTRGIG